MTQAKEPQAPARPPAGKGDAAREARLAQALRANLRRRKAAGRADPPSEAPAR